MFRRLRILAMLAPLCAMLASCDTQAPARLDEDTARDWASALRAVSLLIGITVPPAGVEDTPETCLARFGATEALNGAADELREAVDGPAALPELEIEYGICLEDDGQSLPLDSIDLDTLTRVTDAVIASVDLGLELGDVRERDCVGYEIGVSVRDWLAVDVGGALLAELRSDTASGTLFVPRRVLTYEACEEAGDLTPDRMWRTHALYADSVRARLPDDPDIADSLIALHAAGTASYAARL